MLKKRAILLVAIIIGVLGPSGAMRSIAVARKASSPNPQANLALGEGEVKRLLLLMDPDNDGTVSKQEFMRFMEAEFDTLDQQKEGKLDVKELTQQSKNGFHK